MPASLFRPANDLLVQYATYHRDPRNIVSHFIGIALIVLAVGVLLARVQLGPLSLAWGVWALATAWYCTRGKLALGLATSAVNAALIALAHALADAPAHALAHALAAASMAIWLAWGIGLFVLGWLIQFVGHWWEGRKPAFVDDIVGLLVGPMFVVAEWLLALGWNAPLAAEIKRRAGPARRRSASSTAAG